MFSYVGGDPVNFYDPLGLRKLTSGEIALAQTIFGNSIDYSEVNIYQEAWAGIIPVPSDRAMAPNGNIYFHPDNPYYLADFSSASLDLQGLFIHEMVHVWQNHSGESVILRGINTNYTYKIPCDFDGLGVEQQGNLIMDYFFRSNNHSTRAWGSQTISSSYTWMEYNIALYEFLTNPSCLRQRNEERWDELDDLKSQNGER